MRFAGLADVTFSADIPKATSNDLAVRDALMPAIRLAALSPVLTMVLALGALPAAAQTTRALSKSGGWTLYQHQEGTTRICFLSTAPTSSLPKGTDRSGAQLFIAHWPRDGVKGEVSVKLGYVARKGTPVTVTIGRDVFQLFTAGDRAFIQDATAELKLVEALKKGSTVTVQATAENGASTSDTYSLQGLTQALQALAAGCP